MTSPLAAALLAAALFSFAAPAQAAEPAAAPAAVAPAIPPLTALNGQPLDAAVTAGKVVLFVNAASQCGYTPQYEGLEALWQRYKDQGLVVVGVPCNQFGGQEPGTAEEIQNFCKLNYGVSFPLLSKQEVNGPGRSPLYQALVGSPAGGGGDIKWNFEKFVVGRDGAVRARFPSAVTPADPRLTSAIDAALSAR